jgi:hypothetical protein
LPLSSVKTTATVFVIVITATAVYVASAVSAVLDVAAVFTVSAAIVIVTAAVYVATAIFTATAAVSVYSASTSDRSPHLVSSVRPWSYHLLAPFPQSVTNIWMETDRVGDAGGKGGNLKKNRLSQDSHRLNSDK